MTIEEAIKKIVGNFDALNKKNKEEKYCSYPETEAVWFHQTDHSEAYEVDEEWLGVTRDGKIAWAFASGCSCWMGDFDEKTCDTKSIKELNFAHEDMKEEWQKKLIEFVENNLLNNK